MKRIVIDARESGTTSGRYVDKLIEHLHKLEPQHEFVILGKSHRLEFLRGIAPTFTVEQCDIKEFTFAEQTALKRQIESLKPDLVFFPFVQQPVLYKGRVVTMMQDLTTLRFRNPAKNWFVFTFKREVYRWVNKKAAKKSLHVLTPTEFVKKDVQQLTGIPASKITVTLEAADKITDKPQPIKRLEGKPFIMYVGRPLPHKNLPRLITAYEMLQKTHPDLHLVLVGKKDVLYDRIQADVEARGIKNVIFTGFVSEGELRWLYEHTAAYVFPSLSEGFGLPSLEAMMHGAPVVSSNASCLPEVNKNGAIYFNPLDEKDMSQNIAKVLENKQIANTLRKEGGAVAGGYSWTRMAQQTLDVFNRYL
jgi:glycosyltransferase involved in cell wall biosynthesis